MNSLEDYDFQNVFQLVGIDNFDIDYLKRMISKLCSRKRISIISNAINRDLKYKMEIERLETAKIEHSNKLREDRKTEDEIKNETEKYDIKKAELIDKIKELQNQKSNMHEYMDKYINFLNSASSASVLIFHIINLKQLEILDSKKEKDSLSEDEKEYRHLVAVLNKSFKTSGDVEKYINDNISIMEYIEPQNRNKKSYAYNENTNIKIKYGIKANDEPKVLLDRIVPSGDKVKVYNIGDFAFSNLLYTSNSYSVVSVLRETQNGNISIHNGIIYLSEPIDNDLDFYSNVVFSELVMRNAEKNNFGYIGTVERNKGRDNYRRLAYNELFGEELIQALSFAQNHEGVTNLRFCKDLPSFYLYMNDKVKEMNGINIDEKKPSFDEGGR